MIFYDSTFLDALAIHKVGNHTDEEGIRLSESLLEVDDDIKALLLQYFFTPFKNPEYYHLVHESDVHLNEVYTYVSRIFDKPGDLYEQSKHLAKHLYEQSAHPKVKSGEFFTVYFKDCVVDGEHLDAVGLFKSESKETFLTVYPNSYNYDIEREDGLNLSKLDKGCLIFNKEKEDGYLVTVVDTKKGADAQFWFDHFLHVEQRQDTYFQTKNTLDLCKSFVTQCLPSEFEVNKAEQVDLLNRSSKFFKDKENFNMEEFSQEVMRQPEIIDSFKNYKASFEKDRDMQLQEDFDISEAAVKKQARILKSVIKLDKNFHIYVHGKKELIKQGFDPDSGMNYYQLYYKVEE